MPSRGKLAIVGIGPGNPGELTGRAREVLEQAEYIIGNDTYLAQLGPLIAGKKVITSSMGKEVERARRSIELARDAPVAMVSGGDAGIYG
ncbi:MAG: SAM-dependent methyltransferase, partial [Methanoregulaceae archaeon]|nr:SAM-dependent methyltransferase [Methanoregulaceae archaeon]